MMQVKTIEGQTVHLSEEEVKRVADLYWEHSGKKAMETFFMLYWERAGENIGKALGVKVPPQTEEELKSAIALALHHGDSEMIAEVLFESMEWETAYATLKSIGGDKK